jgi:sialate O-acetylesterase
MKHYVLIAVLQFFLTTVYGDVRLPKLFTDNMVIQRDQPIPIWGWASPNEKVTITFNRKSISTKADKNGKWSTALNSEKFGGPFEMMVKGKNEIKLTNILVGDVWICSGQSNMEWSVKSSNEADAEIAAGNFPLIRHFKVPNTVAATPQDDVTGGAWKICTPATVGDFTAVGYFFAREIIRDQNIPIGLINTSWGGTHSETWTSREAFEGSEEFKSMIAKMPKLNLDSLARIKKDAVLKKLITLQGGLPASEEESKSWKDLSLDDAYWNSMELPSLWESHELGEFDGVVWFRKEIVLAQDENGKTASLDLSMIDDSDEVYVNGTKVGSTYGKYNEKRKYSVPPGILKAGKNVIAVRVEDTGGGGGIYGSEPFALSIDSKDISLRGSWKYRVESILNASAAVGPNTYPTLLFNAMINPLLPVRIKGVLWYQGESNAGRAYQYRKAFPLMISDWRKQWKQGEFPFYFVQLATYNADGGNSQNGSGWAELREAQTMTLALPNTGMAVTTDIGDVKDIHPRNKQDVGKRLAALALARTYNRKIVDSGPMYESLKVEGDRAVLTFSNSGSGIFAKDKYGYLKGFEIAGNDGQFKYAKAFVDGSSRVVVYHDEIKNPVAVRFGWADDASDCNLYNKEGFPAIPFRTDQWKGITEAAKFMIAN